MSKKQFYLNNKRLKAEGVPLTFTDDQVLELARCATDPIYFTRKWVKIVSLDKGLINFDPWSYQEKMIRTFYKNRFTCVMMARQYGKSLTVIAYILHQLIFNDNYSVAIFANKRNSSKKLIQKLKTAYENLPFWMQQGVIEWNKESIKLENGSNVEAGATTESSGRSGSYNCICVESIITVRNKQTQQIEQITIQDLIQRLKKE
jgi:hypothetical protein